MSDSGLTATERCTHILLHDILDYLRLPDVLRAMGVSRLWRIRALNHPTYYGKLCLCEQDPPEAAQAFALRLSRSDGRPVLVQLHRDDLRPFMPQITIHLAHIYSLNLRQCAEYPFSPILEALCRPADILSHLSLQYMPASETPEPQWIVPPDFLASHAPALEWVRTSNIAFADSVPRCFSNVRTMTFGSNGLSSTTFVLPNPFNLCPNLQSLSLSGCTMLDASAFRACQWERLSELTFFGHPVASSWPAWQLPLASVSQVRVHWAGGAESALALADSLSGPLDVTFPSPMRTTSVTMSGAEEPFVIYRAALRGISESHASATTSGPSRHLQDHLTARGSISAFSVPSMTDRIVRLVLALDAWDDFVGLFRPFNALEELVLALSSKTNADFCARDEPPRSRLFCPRLLRLVLSLSDDDCAAVDIGIGAIAAFALHTLPATRFPLRLVSSGVGLTGSCADFPDTFSNWSGSHTRAGGDQECSSGTSD